MQLNVPNGPQPPQNPSMVQWSHCKYYSMDQRGQKPGDLYSPESSPQVSPAPSLILAGRRPETFQEAVFAVDHAASVTLGTFQKKPRKEDGASPSRNLRPEVADRTHA